MATTEEEAFSVQQVDEGVFMCRERFYESWNQANIWIVQGSMADLVIDTGLGIWDLPKFLREHHLIGQKPVQAVATHVHFDHSGGLHQFENVAIHSNEADAIAQGDNYETVSLVTNSEIGLLPREDWTASEYHVQAVKPTKVLKEGDVFDLGNKKLKVLHLPGHSRGSIGLLDEDAKILFSGDVVYDGSMIDWLPYSNISDYIRTCERLQQNAATIEKVCPGHMGMFDSKRLHELVTDYIANASTCHKVMSGCAKGIASVLLRGRNTNNLPCKCCYYACCCCCIFG